MPRRVRERQPAPRDLRAIVRDNPQLASLEEDQTVIVTRVGQTLCEMQKEKGDDWKSPEWVSYIDVVIAAERVLWSTDSLPLVPQIQAPVAALTPVASSSRGPSLAGMASSHTRSRSIAHTPHVPSNLTPLLGFAISQLSHPVVIVVVVRRTSLFHRWWMASSGGPSDGSLRLPPLRPAFGM
ncbi:hypothetical protein C8R46DRAFT_1050299 [Mycena filopes]|nr:hypothetical protein C8R46DRAFT_1050299 [Mycena filopes]